MRRMFSLEQLKGIADARVKALVEGGTLENAKPIYFHPIRFDISGSTAGQTIRVKSGSIMILNNDNTALDTTAKLRAYLYNQGENIDILCNVDFYDSDGLYVGQILSVSANASSCDIKFTKDGVNLTDGSLADTELIVTSDSVNKIN